MKGSDRHVRYLNTLRLAVEVLGGQNAAARAMGIPQPTISRWFSRNVEHFPLDLPWRIEKATGGRVKATDFFMETLNAPKEERAIEHPQRPD